MPWSTVHANIKRVNQIVELTIPEGTRRTRLEDMLFERFPNLSRMYLREVVRDGNCQVNGRNENVGFRVRGGDYIEIELDPSRETAMRPEDISLEIVFEDAHLIVVNKPAGMLVHPTHREKRGTLLNALAHHLNKRSASDGSPPGFIRPGLVHRLDKQTSGLIVAAKSVSVHRKLARQFQRKLVEKVYLALVEGTLAKDEGLIMGPIGRYADEKRWGLKEDGKRSETKFKVRERRSDMTLVELEPVTGRTNQLRIHCASIGHPIVGDVSRGGRQSLRLCLHAWKLSFSHPVTGEVVSLSTPEPFGIDSR